MKFKKGFTLVEVIVTILILAIAAAAMMAMFGRQFTGSAVPAGQVQSQYRLVQQMETITSQYRNELTNNASFSLTSFKNDYIDGKPYVYSSQTGMVTFNYGGVASRSYLRVTLKDGDQKLTSIFTD